MKCEEGGDLGGGRRRDREVRWVIVCEACELGVRKLDELDGTKE